MGKGGGGNERDILCVNNMGENLMKIFPIFFHFFKRVGGWGGERGKGGWVGGEDGMNQ